ncbi:MAG TPA: GTPase HflX [Eggerthellaceae bacterium]|nr:GTPase HflX [Eggerthellaceae bacterium]
MHETEDIRERAILVGVERPGDEWPVQSSLDELERLVDTVGAETVARTVQKLAKPNPKTFIGSGKAEEVAEMCRAYAADVVVFDDELSPSQQANLERAVDKSVKVIDRTALILDIFALHATTREGRLQVRLAQNQYLYPRLRGMWAHLASNRMGGGVGSRFGEGESQLEVDRRMVRKRISSIKRELAHIEEVRSVQRESRYRSGTFKIALAGYTNAGKSSLINRLTGSDVLSYDKLFATLDATTRKLKLPEGREVTITDTIGFIRKLPTTLVESFKSTLDEINGADLILHVIDGSSDELSYQMDTVEEVLGQIGAERIQRLTVFNKRDLIESSVALKRLEAVYPDAIVVSAHTGDGIDELVARIASIAAASDDYFEVLVPYSRGNLVSIAHKRCHIVAEEHMAEGTRLSLYAPPDCAHLFAELTGA